MIYEEILESRGHKSVFGIVDRRSEVEKVVEALKREGFRNADISVLMPHKIETQDYSNEDVTKAPEAAVVGATSGFAIGGTLGWLAGIGALAIPGIGPFIAAGPIVAALAGAGVGSAIGGLAGALVGIGIPEHEVKRYENYITSGGILVSVHVDDAKWAKSAKQILSSSGAHNISSVIEEPERVVGPTDENFKRPENNQLKPSPTLPFV